MEALPNDITNLPKYYVPQQLFISTCILLIVLMIWAIIIVVVWTYRSCKHIHNYEYIVDYNILREYEAAQKAIREAEGDKDPDNNEYENSSASSGDFRTQYTPDTEQDQMRFNRQESRSLELICLSAVVAFNMGSYTSGVLEVISYLVAVIFFLLFNVLRMPDKAILRTLFYVPLFVAYLPFYVFKKEIPTQ